MGSAADLVVGVVTQVGGILKEGVGKVIRSERLQAEGLCWQIEGKVQRRYGAGRLTAIASNPTRVTSGALH